MFKRQSTVKTKQNRHGVFSFELLYYDREVCYYETYLKELSRGEDPEGDGRMDNMKDT